MKISAEALIRLSNQHNSIPMYIDGLPAKSVYSQYRDEVPSIHGIIAYLCRYQHVTLKRQKDICETLNPCFGTYDSRNDPEFDFTMARTTGCLVRELCHFRGQMISYIQGLPPEHGSRIGTHAVLGTMALSQWLEYFLLHESRELFRIFKIACAIRTDAGDAGTFITISGQQQKSG